MRTLGIRLCSAASLSCTAAARSGAIAADSSCHSSGRATQVNACIRPVLALQASVTCWLDAGRFVEECATHLPALFRGIDDHFSRSPSMPLDVQPVLKAYAMCVHC